MAARERAADRALRRLAETTAPRVAVVGAGIEGLSLARYFRRRGAQVAVHAAWSPEQVAADAALQRQAAEVEALGARLHVGEAYLAGVADADIVGVVQSAYTYKYPMNVAVLDAARERGTPIVTNLSLFFALCPAPIVGITGTNGKTTTTEMTDAVLRAGGVPVHTGGNIGQSPLDEVDGLAPSDVVLLELSNYQLDFLESSPHIAAITNIAPDHLVDYAGSFERYAAAKKRILDFQDRDDWAVLNWDDPLLRRWGALAEGQVFAFNLAHTVEPGAFVRRGLLTLRFQGREEAVLPAADLPVPGLHNVANALCAAAIGALHSVAPADIARALRAYRGGPHRLEPVAEVGGATWLNDSKSTTPASTVAAIRACADRPLILLAGGKDKGLPTEELLAAMRGGVRALVAFGEWGPALAEAARAAGVADVHVAAGLPEAVAQAAQLAQAGDTVLLSPAGTSFDAYPSYAARGAHFKRLVEELGQ